MILDLLRRSSRTAVATLAVLLLSIAALAQNTATAEVDKGTRTNRGVPAPPDVSSPEETYKSVRVKTSDPDGESVEDAKEPPSSASSKQANSNGSGWQFAFAPYVYFSGLKGTIGARNRTADINLSVGDVFSNLQLGLMGVFEARKGRFVLVNDMLWIKLAKTVETPGPVFSTVRVGANQFVWTPQAGYRVYESKKGSIDILGGVRLESIENNIHIREGILPERDFTQRNTWATPVIGARGLLNLSPRLFLNGKFDVGGGVGANFTRQVYAGAGFRIRPKIALVGGWRYMGTDYSNDSGFVYDTRMNGLIMGAMFSF
jgi:hypothetical protein